MKSPRGRNREGDENEKDGKLCNSKRRLGLRRSHRMQRRDFFERLHDSDENIEIEGDHSASNVDPAPVSGELTRVTRIDRHRQ